MRDEDLLLWRARVACECDIPAGKRVMVGQLLFCPYHRKQRVVEIYCTDRAGRVVYGKK